MEKENIYNINMVKKWKSTLNICKNKYGIYVI